MLGMFRVAKIRDRISTLGEGAAYHLDVALTIVVDGSLLELQVFMIPKIRLAFVCR